MSRILSFPGLLLFLAAGLVELAWIAPTLRPRQPRESRVARGAGVSILVVGIGLYIMGQLFP